MMDREVSALTFSRAHTSLQWSSSNSTSALCPPLEHVHEHRRDESDKWIAPGVAHVQAIAAHRDRAVREHDPLDIRITAQVERPNIEHFDDCVA